MERIRVLYPSGAKYRNVSTLEARRMLRAGIARVLGDPRRDISAIQLVDGPAQPRAGTRYSHRSATPVNPSGCWTLKRLDDGTAAGVEFAARCFLSVVIDCSAPALAQAART